MACSCVTLLIHDLAETCVGSLKYIVVTVVALGIHVHSSIFHHTFFHSGPDLVHSRPLSRGH